MKASWLDKLKRIVEKKPLVILRFNEEEWDSLKASRRGVNEFTIARTHKLVKSIHVPTPCLIQAGKGMRAGLFFGLVSSRSPITTLESRLKITRGVRVSPNSQVKLVALLTEARHSHALKRRLAESGPVILLSPKLSSHLVDRLASVDSNRGPMRSVLDSIRPPKRYAGNVSFQEDAVRTALAAFGVSLDERADGVELVPGKETALARISVMEDAVIEHDARSIPGYDLVGSDITGKATFRGRDDTLEVITANRRDLEHCLGVDLIYINLTRHNVVMVQYKMLERHDSTNQDTDWIYRPDSQLDTEIARMKRLKATFSPTAGEYRLNAEVFYLKFVKRNAAIKNGGIVTPLDHFELLKNDPACRGPKKGLRISYTSLRGRYLRQAPFVDLVRSGYIGAYAESTATFRTIIDAILRKDRAVIAAIQKPRTRTNGV